MPQWLPTALIIIALTCSFGCGRGQAIVTNVPGTYPLQIDYELDQPVLTTTPDGTHVIGVEVLKADHLLWHQTEIKDAVLQAQGNPPVALRLISDLPNLPIRDSFVLEFATDSTVLQQADGTLSFNMRVMGRPHVGKTTTGLQKDVRVARPALRGGM